MQKEKYLIIPRSKDFSIYVNNGFNSFILPLENFSVAFDNYYIIDEINSLSKKYNIFVIINKLLHKDIKIFKNMYNKFNKNIKFIIEDLGLCEIIDKDRVVIFENHIESNYKAINYLKSIGYDNVVINKDLTINEINEIRSKCDSKLYFFLINRNMLMYSKRKLVSNYKKFYNIDDDNKRYVLTEDISKIQLEINEEDDSSTLFCRKLFSGNKYIKDLEKLDYLIINTNSMSDLELKVTLEHYNDEELINILDTDYYFLENDIKYKVGDIK